MWRKFSHLCRLISEISLKFLQLEQLGKIEKLVWLLWMLLESLIPPKNKLFNWTLIINYSTCKNYGALRRMCSLKVKSHLADKSITMTFSHLPTSLWLPKSRRLQYLLQNLHLSPQFLWLAPPMQENQFLFRWPCFHSLNFSREAY